MPDEKTERGTPKTEPRNQPEQGDAADGGQRKLGVIGGTLTAAVPQHLSEDDSDLDRVAKASADSFPASDPPSQP